MKPKIIIPYVKEEDIRQLLSWITPDLDVCLWRDTCKIGADLAYQTLWNTFSDRDIIILHTDMSPLPEDTNNSWYYQLLEHVEQYPEAGIFGTTLLYPAKNEEGHFFIQHAGGRFNQQGTAVHFGGGLDLSTNKVFGEVEVDQGQYNNLREVSFVTFGGVYIRRSVFDAVGDYDPRYIKSYYRDVDYCLEARKLGFKVYQTPVKLLHYESKSHKETNPSEMHSLLYINGQIFKEKWKDSSLVCTLNRVVDNE